MLEDITNRVSLPTAVAGTVGATVLYIALFSVFRYLSTPSFDAPLEHYPHTKKGKHHFMSVHWLLKEHFTRYRNAFWKIIQPHCELVLIPLKYVDELRNLPESQISFTQENEDRFSSSIIGMSTRSVGGDDNTMIKSIRHDLTRHLNGVMPDIWDETVFAFEKEVGDCEDWKEVNVYRFTTQIVALISGRVFAGPELNRNPEYVQAIINYTIVVFTAAAAVGRYPWFLRRFAANYLVPEMRTVRQSQREMQRIMAPVVAKRREAMADGKAAENMTTWNLRNSPESQRNSMLIQAHLQLGASMAAVHTTAMQTSHVLFDLAARPEYVAPLRAEIEAAVAASETGGNLDKRSMPKLRKLDSFMKESQRLNPLGLMTFNRKVMADITLHDGTQLRRGMHIGVPSSAHATDEQRFEHADEFDGFRFARLRDQPGAGTKYQFVETGVGPNDLMNFGHGSHACPGRFFAGNEIKVIMTYLLQNYDLKLPDGQSRPANIYTDGGMRPDPRQVVLLRKRKAAA